MVTKYRRIKVMKKAWIAGMVLLASGAVFAADLASWNFDGVDWGYDAAPAGTKAAGVDTATVQVHGDEASASGRVGIEDCDEASAAAALASGIYISISLSAEEGQALTVTNLSLWIDYNNNLNGGIAIYSDTDSYTTPVFTGDMGNSFRQEVPLTGHEGLSSVEFRFVRWGSTAAASDTTFGDFTDGDGETDVLVQGSVGSSAQQGTLIMVK
jgi:hypothetical protein